MNLEFKYDAEPLKNSELELNFQCDITFNEEDHGC